MGHQKAAPNIIKAWDFALLNNDIEACKRIAGLIAKNLASMKFTAKEKRWLKNYNRSIDDNSYHNKKH